MTVATSDGEAIWIFRYSSEKATSSLYYSNDSAQVRELYPELDVLDRLGADARFVVSNHCATFPARGPKSRRIVGADPPGRERDPAFQPVA